MDGPPEKPFDKGNKQSWGPQEVLLLHCPGNTEVTQGGWMEYQEESRK